jgi:prolyl oligopeptidase
MPEKKLPPKTRKVEVVERIHGVDVSDLYRWLEENSKETQSWIKEQNAFSRSVLNKTSAKTNIKKRLGELFKIDAIGIPVPRGSRYFFEERKGTDDLSILYVQDGLEGSPRELINPNTLSKDKTVVLNDWVPSPDGELLVYSLSEAANDQVSIHVLDVTTGEKLSDIIPAKVYPEPTEWSPDNKGFWYTHRHPNAPEGEEKFHQKLYFHKLGSDYINDPMIFGQTIKKEDIPSVDVSKDGRYLLITVYILSEDVEKTELYIQDRQNPEKGFVAIVKGIDALFFGEIHRDTIYIMTNYQAPLWKIMAVKISNIEKGPEEWKTLVPEGTHKIECFAVVKDRLFVERLENVCSTLKAYDLSGNLVSEITLPALGSVDAITGEEEGEELFFGFSSFFVPKTIYRFNLKTNQYTVFKKAEAGIDTDLFTVEQVWFRSKDGTKVPMFIVHKRGIELNGDNPTLLYGYGGFNISLPPVFSKTIIPFLENGGIYVVPNIRGGGEFGEKWHKAGMREKKQNVFDDFIAAAEWLIENKYTNPQRLAIFGWSNGGLLVGAALTQRPDLFKAVVIGGPLLDMLRYHLFHGGRLWIPECGSAEDAEQLRYLIEYSPYHNVKAGTNYPAVLIVTADKDDRVHPMHAYKMAAKLQDATAQNITLLRVERKAGHGGAAPIYRVIEQYADIWSFVFWQLKMKK